jgi:hypothetical protein
MERNKQESPTGGSRQTNVNVVDQVEKTHSGLSEGGFYRPVGRFNRNEVMRSPTTSSKDFRGKDQEIIINKGIAGKIK